MEDTVEIRHRLLEKAKSLPQSPGVYLMRGANGEVIYVGKSKALKNRVMSYFQFSERHNRKTETLVGKIREFECIYTQTEAEALILENELIKLHRPKYNIKLKDDKNYPYIRLSQGESFPRLSVVRRREGGKEKYFGPYSSQKAAGVIVDTANALFGLPVCHKQFPRDIGKERPCLYYHMGRCVGVCTGKVSSLEYKEKIKQVATFLKEDHKALREALEQQMQEASARLEFERAAQLRDCMLALEKLGKKQQIVRDPEFDADVFGLYADELGSCICQLKVRGGRLIDSRLFHFSAEEILDAESFSSTLVLLYSEGVQAPERFLFDERLFDGKDSVVCEYLSKLSQRRILFAVPERGDGKRLVELAGENAREATLHRRELLKRNQDVCGELGRLLGLEKTPSRIEAVDISNHGDSHITAGMICLQNNSFSKKDYKQFHIRRESRDDVGAMEEACYRRFARARAGEESFLPLPDLFLADGGPAQVTAVKNALRSNGLELPVFGMVKDSFHKTRCLTDGENEIAIAKNQAVYQFIYRIQEEVHRYAFSRMDQQRRKTVRGSSLERIEGIGPQKAKALMKHFRSVQAVSLASPEALTAVPGIGSGDAQRIFEYFQKKILKHDENG